MSVSYREFVDEDEVGIRELLKKTFPVFKNNDLWFWKYRLNPDFDHSLLLVAEKDGEIVGSNYWISRSLKLSSTLQVRAALGADVAVHPDSRGQGIGKELLRFPRISRVFKEKGILLSYMFSSIKLTKRFQSPAAGYITAPAGTVVYRKLLTCKELKEKIEQINRAIRLSDSIREQLKELSMSISFKLRGIPPFSIHVLPEKVYLEEGEAEDSDAIIEGSVPLSSFIFEGGVSAGDLVKFLLTGKIRIKKGFFQLLRLRRIFVLFQAALNQESRS